MFYGEFYSFTERRAKQTYTPYLASVAVKNQVVEAKGMRSMYVPLSLWVKAREEAARRGTSVNQIVVEALRYYLEERPFFLCMLALLPRESGEFERAVEILREMLSKMENAPELEQRAKALAELLTKEKKVSSGG
jgi:hypothetical protein